MRRLPRVTSAEVAAALRRAGWRVLRQAGSRAQMSHARHPGRRVTVALHGSKPVPPGTLKAILDQAGVSVEELDRLL